MKKGDLILLIVAVCGLIGVLAFWIVKHNVMTPSGYGIDCVVYEKNEEIGRYPLNQDAEIIIKTSDGHYNTLVIKDCEASITESDCKNQICVNTKNAVNEGDTIICLPHKISVVLEGSK